MIRAYSKNINLEIRVRIKNLQSKVLGGEKSKMLHFSFCGEHAERPFVERSSTPKGCGLDLPQGSHPHSRVALVLCGVRGGGRTEAGPTHPALRPGCSAGRARGPDNLPRFPQTRETSGGSRRRTGDPTKPQPRTPCPGARRWRACGPAQNAGVALRSCAGCCTAGGEGRAACAPPTVAPSPPGFPRVNVPPQFQGWCVHWERRVSRGPHPRSPALSRSGWGDPLGDIVPSTTSRSPS